MRSTPSTTSRSRATRSHALADACRTSSCPRIHGERAAAGRRPCDDALLPRTRAIRTPHTELSNMFLIEAERGCSRGCTYCVMRRSTNGGMRIVPNEVVLDAIPRDARQVGLVGAAVTDHPKIAEIVRRSGRPRPRGRALEPAPRPLNDEFVGALAARRLPHAHHRARRRERAHARHHRAPRPRAALRCAPPSARARHGMRSPQALRDGRPARRDRRRHRRVRALRRASSRRSSRMALGIAPFCAKRNTPLDGMPFAGIRTRRSAARAPAPRPARAAPTCAPSAPSGPGSSTCSRRAASPKRSRSTAPCRPAAASPPTVANSTPSATAPDGRGYAETEAPIAPERLKHRHLNLAGPS